MRRAGQAGSTPTSASPIWISTVSTPPFFIRAWGSLPAPCRTPTSPQRSAAPTTAGLPIIADPTDRLFGVAMLPMQSVPHAIEEMRFARKELGFKGAFLRPNPYNNKMIDHPEYEP